MQSDQPIILMYHGVVADKGSIPPDREVGADIYDVSVRDFRQQMAFIKDSSCFVTTFDKEKSLPDGKRIILTFDDGEMNNYVEAFPVLKEFGFQAYFFVTVNRIGKNGYMGWNELKALCDANMTIGSHSLSHQIMTKLDVKDIREELERSKQVLEDRLQVPVLDFSVPRGFYNKEVVTLAVNAGYQRIFISERQQYFDSNCLPRVAVKRNWSVSRLQDALRNRIPVMERFRNMFKKVIRALMGDAGYDAARSVLLRK